MARKTLTPATEEEMLTSPEFAVFRDMLWRNRDQIMGMTQADDTGMEAAITPTEGPMEDETVDEVPVGGEDEAVSFAAGPKADEYADWEAKQAAYVKRASEQRQRQFDDAKRYIEETYRGPSLSEQLMTISQALLSPRAYGGVKGTLAKLAPAFGGIQKSQRTAAEQRAKMLMDLQQRYQTGELEAEGDVLKSNLAVIKARAAANKPTWARTVDPVTGEVTMTPVFANQGAPASGGVNIPVVRSPAQLKTLPPNVKFFIAADDPTQTPRRVPGR